MATEATTVPRGAAGWRGLLAVTATYVAFLLHAQFGFLALVQRHVEGASVVRQVMACMAVAGLVASLATGRLLARVPARRLVVSGLIAAALAEVASLACRGAVAFGVAAAAVGASIGVLTVALASDLRTLVPGPRLGLRVGVATGLAYLASNLPATFHGGAVVQALVPAAACVLAAALLAFEHGARATGWPEPSAALALTRDDVRGWGFASLVLSFLALVWLDSAAFRIIQETTALRGQTWGTPAHSTLQGVVHLAAAALAGWLVDRGAFRSLLVATLALFAGSFTLLQANALPVTLAGPIYAAGISAYSTALVLVPSLGPAEPGPPRRWRAALVYGVAGWIGSTLGIGMAEDLHRIPGAFIAAAGAVVALSALLASQGGRALARVHAPALAVAAPVLALQALLPREAPASAVERGRRAYVAEGCINCHSQYVRPDSRDVAAWGPHRDAVSGQAPPLIGNRRQGPDLLNVGNRRTAEWQRLHLEDPRAISPGSRMPSYAHLFEDGSGRGDDLVAYLSSLGADTAATRWSAVATNAMACDLAAADAERGRAIYAAACASCHGPDGRGGTATAARLARPLVDLTRPELPLLAHAHAVSLEDVARVARFGLPGSPMAGHEWLSDEDAACVAAWVLRLREAAASPGSPAP